MDYSNENAQLNTISKDLLGQAIASDNVSETKSIINLFNLNETKKSMIRVNKLNDIQDNVTRVINERLEKNPNNFSTDDLVKIMKVTQDCLSNSQQLISKTDEIPQISMVQNNQINIVNNQELSRDSRNKIADAVAKFIQLTQQTTSDEDDSDEYEMYNNIGMM